MAEFRYLGDGVHARHDGYQTWLYCERDGRTHEIALEPAVVGALNAFIRDVYREHGMAPPTEMNIRKVGTP